MAAQARASDASAVQRAARAVGAAFLVAGCLGFLPGATTHLEQLQLTGPGSSTALLGLLPVTVAGNVVHLAFAVAAALCLRSDSRARAYLLWGGALYMALCARSIVVGTGTVGATAGASGGLRLAVVAGAGMVVAAWLTSGAVAGRLAPVTGIRRTD